jgi:hypothetical protein
MARKQRAHVLCKYKQLTPQMSYFRNKDGDFLDVFVRRFDAQKSVGASSGHHFAVLRRTTNAACSAQLRQSLIEHALASPP